MNNSKRTLIPFLIFVAGFFTFGLSDLWFIYLLSDRIDRKRFLPMKQLALTLITFGIYGIIWTFNITRVIKYPNNSITTNKSILYIILSILFLRSASTALIYRDFNAVNNTGAKTK